ncbi:HlyD family secretion protein [Emcibacter sp.]|uniref:HlyD family secretion protein n=1 Tax=Emcibacter sp. TaxID=1979954 RepID=UPI002AA6898B|nr:HlyD family efflux transporter periplasmic adaptor subunit [Emcibacter sp.]
MTGSVIRKIVIFIIILAAIVGGVRWWQAQQEGVLIDFASGNGRIEADQVDVATKYGGRIVAIYANEGDLVEQGRVLAVMDTAEEEALLEEARAAIAQAEESVREAQATIRQRESELKFAEQELERTRTLVQKGHVSQQQADQKTSTRDIAAAALQAAGARLSTTEQAVASARAEVRRIKIQIDEATLKAPVTGRVLYRLAENGEVLAGGGKVLTLIDLSDIYMTIFLPSAEAARVRFGAEARIRIDALPGRVIPAVVTFVSPEAQFTPKQVETRDEREKLMFRIKVTIPGELVTQNIDRVKTGVRGQAFVRLNAETPWPDELAVNLTQPGN